MDTISTIIFCGLILSLASMIQAAVGFAYALFATPLLVWLGIPLHQVIVMVSVGSLLQSVAGVRSLHASIPWKEVGIATALSIVGLIAGLFILRQIISLDSRYILMIVGIALSVLVLVQLLFKPRQVDKVRWPYTILAFLLSGVFSGTIGMGGPPLVLWVMAHDWEPAKIKGFYFASFLLFIPIMIFFMAVLPGFGSLSKPILFSLAFFPLIYAGSLIGLKIGNRLSKRKLYVVTSVFLLLTGISTIISAMS
ncbi:MAG: sulfite exporter TauE/SafE family protein [Proteiniphilum sp.]